MGQMTRRRIWPMLLVVIAAFAYDSGCQFVGARRGQQLARSRHFSVRSQSLGLRAQKDQVKEEGRKAPGEVREDPDQERARLLVAAEKLQSQAEAAMNEGQLEKAKVWTKLASERRLLASEISTSQVPVIEGAIIMTAQEWMRLGENGGKKCFEKAVEADDNYADGWSQLGHLGGGRLRGVAYSEKACYERAVALEPNSALHWRNLASVGGGAVQGSAHSGKECTQKALELDDTDAYCWNSLGKAGGGRLRGKEYSETACYERAVALEPESARFWNDYASSAAGGRAVYRGSKQLNCRAVELDPRYADAWNSLGIAGGGNVHGHKYYATGCFKRAVELDETSAIYWTNFGESGGTDYYDTGPIHRPIACFENALELDDKYARAWSLLGDWGGGQVHGKEYSKRDCHEMAAKCSQ